MSASIVTASATNAKASPDSRGVCKECMTSELLQGRGRDFTEEGWGGVIFSKV